MPDDPISVIHLEDPIFIQVAKVDDRVVVAVADMLPKVLLTDTVEVEVEIDDDELEVEIVEVRETLTEFDEAQIALYNAYGNATNGRAVLYALGTLVNETLPDGTNGVV